MPNLYKNQPSTIPDGTAIGATVIDLDDSILHGVIMDAAWDVGDKLGFKVAAEEGDTFVPLYDPDGVLVSLSLAASQAWALDPRDFGSWRWIKPWSQDGAGADANQTGDTVVMFTSK